MKRTLCILTVFVTTTFCYALSDGHIWSEDRNDIDRQNETIQFETQLQSTLKSELVNRGVKNATVNKTDEGLTVSLENIFDKESETLKEGEEENVKQVAEAMMMFEKNNFLIKGHTALFGSEKGRRELSEKRARMIADYFVKSGIKTRDKITVLGLGAEVPIASNRTEVGKARNRRVEITVLNTVNDNLDEDTETIIFEVKERNKLKEDLLTRNRQQSFLNSSRKYFALGTEVSGVAANPHFKITDFFQPVLNVDFNHVSDSVSADGFSVGAAGKAKVYFDIYIKQKHEFGVYAGVDTYSFLNIPKNLIDFIAKGNPEGNGLSGSILGNAHAFADAGIFYGTSIKSFRFRVRASYYVPLFYMQQQGGDYEFVTDPETGRFLVKGDMNLNLYMPVNISDRRNIGENTSKAVKKGGIDIDFSGSYRFNKYAGLDFSLLHIPLIPAYMDKGFALSYSGSFTLNSTIEYLNALLERKPLSKIKPPAGSFSSKGPDYELPRKVVLRPIKFNVGVEVNPFGNRYLTIVPSLGFHLTVPFYVDLGLRLETRFLNVFGLYASIGREDRIWKNTAGFFIDARALRFEVFAAAAATSFTSSFKASGAEAGVKVVMGF